MVKEGVYPARMALWLEFGCGVVLEEALAVLTIIDAPASFATR